MIENFLSREIISEQTKQLTVNSVLDPLSGDPSTLRPQDKTPLSIVA